MKKFQVTVEFISYRTFEVEAESETEVEDIIRTRGFEQLSEIEFDDGFYNIESLTEITNENDYE